MMTAEALLFAAGSSCYAVGAGFAWRRRRQGVGAWLLIGAMLFAIGIAVRWVVVGHGPFLTLYEILISSLFSLGLLYGLANARCPQTRGGAPVATLVLLVLSAWMLVADPHSSPLPATYGNPWLWAHVLAGKLFLGSCLVASSLAAAGLLSPGGASLQGPRVMQVAWRWLMAAFVCHSAMLVAGAVWAQDAWGRYWAWDPLETWAFGTWLVMVIAFHAKAAYRLSPRVERWLVVSPFVLGFLTFFGVPFLSLAPHKGAV